MDQLIKEWNNQELIFLNKFKNPKVSEKIPQAKFKC